MHKLLTLLIIASLAFAVGCGGSSSSSSSGSGGGSGGGTGSNVLAITVDGGPTASSPSGSIYANGLFASAKICQPGSTTSCVTVDHLLVDTGSVGLRVLQSAIPGITLAAVNAANGSAAYDCVSFVDGSFLWGPVQLADVTLGGETASSVPVHVVADPSAGTFAIPTSCSNGGTDEDTQAALLANGILGVGPEPNDCGSYCDPSAGGAPPAGEYYTCTSGSSGTCSSQFVAVASQTTNPVVLMPNDNNGVILELPSVSSVAATLTGSLIFGVGTQSNNQVTSSQSIFTLDQFLNLQAVYKSQTLGSSFIDSGSNAFFFPDSTIPLCASNSIAPNFFCPTSIQDLSASLQDPNGTGVTKSTNFSVDNAVNLFTNNANDAVYSTLGGTNSAGSFDFGLPFFYGKNVYSTIQGQSLPSALPAAPWVAF